MGKQSGLRSLFDLSFAEFITPGVMKVLFVILIAAVALGTLFMIIGAFTAGIWLGVLTLILSPVIFLLYALFARVWCEMIMVLFRIAENTSGLREPGNINAGEKAQDA